MQPMAWETRDAIFISLHCDRIDPMLGDVLCASMADHSNLGHLFHAHCPTNACIWRYNQISHNSLRQTSSHTPILVTAWIRIIWRQSKMQTSEFGIAATAFILNDLGHFKLLAASPHQQNVDLEFRYDTDDCMSTV